MSRWTWKDAELPPGQCVLVDVDGVISDAWHRQHFLDGATRRWDDFFAAAHDDDPLLPGVTLLDLLGDEVIVTLLTARPDTIHDETLAWLSEYEVRWDLLIMRGRREQGPSPVVKRHAVEGLWRAGYEPVLAFDDDQRNIAMFQELDIPALYIHSGYYEA